MSKTLSAILSHLEMLDVLAIWELWQFMSYSDDGWKSKYYLSGLKKKEFWIPIQMLFFKKDFIYLFLERGREGERERNINV